MVIRIYSMTLEGYKDLTTLQETEDLQLLSAKRAEDGIPVLIKTSIGQNRQAADNILRREYTISRNIPIKEICRPVEIIEKDCCALIYDFDGIPLSVVSSTFHSNILNCLSLIRRIADILSKIHQIGIIQRYLSTNNIFITSSNDDLGEKSFITLTGFELAAGYSANSIELHNVSSDQISFQNLEYIAPELTGMTDSVTDHRADLYSLGIIFYELLTGTVPFKSGDRLEMLHWHVARVPQPPHEVNGSVPKVVSAMVMKLLAKSPEERYSDAEQFLEDLNSCFNAIACGGLTAEFEIQSQQQQWSLKFPDRLFGRGKEKRELQDMLDSVSNGMSALSLVRGSAGTGKTVLIDSIRNNVISKGGYYIHGKCEQYQSDMPYYSFSEAFRNLIRQLLLESDESINLWKKKITKSLSPNIQLILEIIPELTYIVGSLKQSKEVDPINARILFYQYVAKFIQIFTSRKKPLVIVLDDIHWIDSSGLDLLLFLVSRDDLPYLYIIGAYRDTDIESEESLLSRIESIESNAGMLHQVDLFPLSDTAVVDFIQETMGSRFNYWKEFSAIVYRKTGGNPFFIREFLHEIYRKGYVYTDKTGKIDWNPKGIAELPVSDNVVEFLASTISRLSPVMTEVLKAAACVGSSFDEWLIIGLVDRKPEWVMGTIRKLVLEDLFIDHGNSRYAFAHDRIQESAYMLIPLNEKLALHKKIGELIHQLYKDKKSDYIFSIVDHLNHSITLHTSKEEKEKLYHLNVEAGRKAKESTAYLYAVQYYIIAYTLLSDDIQKSNYELAYSFYHEYGECLYLNSTFNEAKQIVNIGMKYAISPVEIAELMKILIHIYMLEAKFEKAINTGWEALDKLDQSIDIENIDNAVHSESAIIENYIHNYGVDAIASLNTLSKSDVLSAINIIRILSLPAYFIDHQLLELLSLKMITLTIEHGLSVFSLSGFVSYAVLLCHKYGNYKLGHQFSILAMNLSERFKSPSLLCEAIVKHANLIMPWVCHLKESDELNKKGLEAGFSSGEYEYVGYVMVHSVMNKFYLSDNMQRLFDTFLEFFEITKRIKSQMLIDFYLAMNLVFQDIQGKIENDIPFDSSLNSEDDFLTSLQKRQSFIALFHFYTSRAQLLYLYGEYSQALQAIEDSAESAGVVIGSFHHSDRILYYSLTLIALAAGCDDDTEKAYLEIVNENQKQMKIWADNCHENFLHRYYIVEAEKARLKGDIVTAMSLYDTAIESARENGYKQIEAVSSELAGKFWYGLKKDNFGESYLKQAFNCYNEWGAKKKCVLMEKEYPQLFHKAKDDFDNLSSKDLLAVLRAFNMMSSQLDVKVLFETVINLTLQYSGAQRLVLLMERNGKLYIEAEGSADLRDVKVLLGQEISENEKNIDSIVPIELIRYVARTGETVILDSTANENFFSESSYIDKHMPLSLLCASHRVFNGSIIWYMENNLIHGVFAGLKQKVLTLLMNQAAICIQNALYNNEQNQSEQEAGFSFKLEGKYYIIPYHTIIYLTSHGRHTIINTNEKSYEIPLLLKDVEEDLPSDIFMRIHKQSIVNVEYACRLGRDSTSKYLLYLNDDDDTVLTIGRTYIGEIKKVLKL